MTDAEKDYAEARLKVALARARALDTGNELKEQLAPQSIAHRALSKVRTAGEDLADRGMEAVRANPAPAAGIGVAAAALLFRRPLLRGVRRLFSRKAAPKNDKAD